MSEIPLFQVLFLVIFSLLKWLPLAGGGDPQISKCHVLLSLPYSIIDWTIESNQSPIHYKDNKMSSLSFEGRKFQCLLSLMHSVFISHDPFVGWQYSPPPWSHKNFFRRLAVLVVRLFYARFWKCGEGLATWEVQ